MEKKAIKLRRKRYIVDKRFQFRLILKFITIVIVFGICSLSLLAYVFYEFGSWEAESPKQPALPLGLSDSLEPVAPAQTYTVFELLWPVLSISLFLMMLFTFIYGIFLSHRMAGPVFRMKRMLGDMSGGNLSGPRENLRKKDEFVELFNDIQNLKESWRNKIQELQLLCHSPEDTSEGQNLVRIRKIISTFQI